MRPDMEELDYLATLEFFGIKLGLEQTRELFRRLGNPHENLKFIHVAGSNGKGSVCAMLEQALRSAGLKTGFYSSPHLIQVGERFRINGVSASDTDVARAVKKLRPVIADMAEKGMHVTYFEATTAIAASLFAEAGCDIVLWETGMGGRLDSTSIVTPLVSVITGISLEHADRLGGTLEKIAFEKAGIIKQNVPVFCASATPEEAKDVIRRRAAELNVPLSFSQPAALTGFRDRNQLIRLADGTELATPLAGPHQRNNAALAYAVLTYLQKELGFPLDRAVQGMALTRWDCRFQIWNERKLILDAAHNPEGLAALAGTLQERFPDQKFHFLFGAFSDKDTAKGLALLAPLALSFRFIHMDTNRVSRTAAELAEELKNTAPGISCSETTLADALRSGQKEWRVLCGSLHLCGEALHLLQKDEV